LPRFVHLAPAAAERIARRGIAGAPVTLTSEQRPIDLRRGVFAMPWLPDFSATHQWLRELRRWRDGRMVAVHFRVPRGEEVYVGRFGAPHARTTASKAVAWVQASPAGAEVVVPRSILLREVVDLHTVTQLVGWTDTPEATQHFDYVCRVCLPHGRRDRHRRIRAAYQRSVLHLRDARSTDAVLRALGPRRCGRRS
jgi:hypothetical protein